MFAVTVEFKLHSDHVDAFRAAIKAQARNSLQREEGCRYFDVCFDHEDPTICFLYELYTDAAAFEAHKQTPHFADFNQKVQPCVADKKSHRWERIDV